MIRLAGRLQDIDFTATQELSHVDVRVWITFAADYVSMDFKGTAQVADMSDVVGVVEQLLKSTKLHMTKGGAQALRITPSSDEIHWEEGEMRRNY